MKANLDLGSRIWAGDDEKGGDYWFQFGTVMWVIHHSSNDVESFSQNDVLCPDRDMLCSLGATCCGGILNC